MLTNTIYRIKHEKTLTVGYFGGSITEGAGASDAAATSWRGAIFNRLKSSFPDCQFTSIQAAIGGTGSSLGIFRCERDLLSKKPDLVFIEFSVNDAFCNYHETLANSEAIVRKIYAANPFADIVYLHTTTKEISDRIASGGDFIARSAHSAVMYRYAIPQLDVGEILRSQILSTSGNWLDLTTDLVHPNDAGYAVYTKAVAAFLDANLTAVPPSALTAKVLPPRISTQDRTSARLVDSFEVVDTCASTGWSKVESSLCGRYDHFIEATTPGASLSFRFTGTRVGLYAMLAKDSGDLLYEIDGVETNYLSTWDTYCKRFNRAGGMLLGGELPYGDHRVTLRVAETKADESEGHCIRIGALMVY